jgi:hypothetical protein
MKNKLLLIVIGLTLTTKMIIAQVPNYAPTNGLVGYWSFNGNANDSSANANNGIVNGATLTTDRFGNTNSAYSFNGINNYIRINNTLLPSTPTSYTISLWYNTQNFTSQNGNPRMLISDRNTGLSSYKYTINLSTTGHLLGGGIYNGSGTSGNGVTGDAGDAGVNNNWHNAIFIYDSSIATLYLYIDGSLVNTTTNVTHWSSGANPTNIGYWNGFVGASGFFDGKIDDIGIWNRVLAQSEITSLYYSESTCQSLVINTGVLGFNPLTYNNTVTIYPNPANDHITIDCGNLANVSGWNIKIANTLGQEVFNGVMNTQQYVVPLNTWGGQGIYFVKIYDASNNLMNSKKIILQ